MFKWLCLLFVLNVLFESIYLYIKSVNSLKIIDVPRKWTLYGDLETFPYTATLFMVQLIIALIYGITIIVLYNMVILKLVMIRKIKPKYRIYDMVRVEHIDIPLVIFRVKRRYGKFKFCYILDNGIIVPEDLILEVIDEQR